MNKKILLLSLAFLCNFAYAQNIVNMSVDSTFSKLLISAKRNLGFRLDDRPHFDSTLVESVVNFIDKNPYEQQSHILLIRLKFDYPNIYSKIADTLKVKILCKAFNEAISMNYWGILTPENQVALEGGTMLKELGTKTIFCLKESLSDTTLLKYGWNGETKALPFVYKWRKKDFAYFFIAKAIDEKPIFLQTPEQRDKIIDDFVLRNKKLLIKKE